MIKIIVPGKPQGKGRPRFSRKTGRAYTPEATARYENFIALLARDEMDGPPLLGPLRVTIEAYVAVPKSWKALDRAMALLGLKAPETKPDVDNAAKVMDALNGIVWIDDKQVARLEVEKFYSDNPRMELTIRGYFSQD